MFNFYQVFSLFLTFAFLGCLNSSPTAPTGSTKAQFDHSNILTNCSTCHLQDPPTSLVQEMSHSVAGLPDCSGCHSQNIGKTWSGGVYSHTPTPNSCQECHSPQRPSGLIGTPPFDHFQNNGTGDCNFCHKSSGSTWSGGTFNHSPAPSTCMGCHLSTRPTAPVGTPSFDHNLAGQADCVNCHTLTSPLSWANGQFSHTPTPSSCSTCHISEKPTSVINKMDHSYSGLPDCSTCHHQPGVSWAPGVFNHPPTPTSCMSCHLSQGQTQHGTSVTECSGCHKSTQSWSN